MPLMLNATQLLALCIACAFLFSLVFLHRRMRTVMEPPRRKTDLLLFESMLPPRPAVWLAVRAARRLSPLALKLVTRLMGLLLAAVAVQFAVNGLSQTSLFAK